MSTEIDFAGVDDSAFSPTGDNSADWMNTDTGAGDAGSNDWDQAFAENGAPPAQGMVTFAAPNPEHILAPGDDGGDEGPANFTIEPIPQDNQPPQERGDSGTNEDLPLSLGQHLAMLYGTEPASFLPMDARDEYTDDEINSIPNRQLVPAVLGLDPDTIHEVYPVLRDTFTQMAFGRVMTDTELRGTVQDMYRNATINLTILRDLGEDAPTGWGTTPEDRAQDEQDREDAAEPPDAPVPWWLQIVRGVLDPVRHPWHFDAGAMQGGDSPRTGPQSDPNAGLRNLRNLVQGDNLNPASAIATDGGNGQLRWNPEGIAGTLSGIVIAGALERLGSALDGERPHVVAQTSEPEQPLVEKPLTSGTAPVYREGNEQSVPIQVGKETPPYVGDPTAPGNSGKLGKTTFVKELLPTKLTPTKSDANLFEIKYTGPINYLLMGGGEEFWADGIDNNAILEAKFVNNVDRSPFLHDSNIPPDIRAIVNAKVSDEFRRMALIIREPTNPLSEVTIITNEPRANTFFQSLLDQYKIPGKVVNP